MRSILVFLFLTLYLLVQAQTNDYCRDAIEVFESDRINVDFGASRTDYTPSNSCDYNTDDENVWYKIEGKGKVIKISLCGSWYRSIRVFTGGCYSLTCLDPVKLVGLRTDCTGGYATTATFYGGMDETYYILCSTSILYYPATLKVEMIDLIENNTCADAMPITIDSTITYNSTGASSSGFITCNTTQPSRADAWFSFAGTGELIKIQNSSLSFYKTVYEGSCNQFKCVPEVWINEEAAYKTELGVTYYLQLFSSDFEDQTFSLHPVKLVENDDCEDAIPLIVGDTLLATFVDTKEDLDACNPNDHGGGYDIWYHFVGNDSVLNIHRLDVNIKARVLSGDCDNLQCQELTQFRPDYTNSLFTEAGKNYYLNLFKRKGPDTVSLYTTFEARVKNNTYSDAITINCTDTVTGTLRYAQHDEHINETPRPSVWYKFESPGGFYKVSSYFTGDESTFRPSIFFFKAEDGDLVRTYDFSNGYIYFEPNSLYYINVVSNSRVNPFWLKLNCFPLLEHDLCSDAKLILPRDTIEDGFPYAQPTEDISCNRDNYGDIWYQIEGDGGLYNIGMIDSRYSKYDFALYKGDCSSLTCISPGYSDSFKRITLEEGRTYFIKVSANSASVWNESLKFRIYFEQLPVAPNDVCENATMLECGSTLRDSLDFAVENDQACHGFASLRGIWYRLEGTGRYYSIDIDVHEGKPGYYSTSRNNFTLFKGTCDGIRCIKDQSNFQDENLTFFAESGETYYLVYHYYTSYYIDISVDCIDYLDNDAFENAVNIECNKRYTGYSHDNTYQSSFTDCNHNSQKDIWFKMVGSGEYITSRSRDIKGVYTLEEYGLSCYRAAIFNRAFLEEGVTYYFRYVPTDLEEDYIKAYDFEILCGYPLDNVNCDAAIELNCGDSLAANLLYAKEDQLPPSCNSNSNGDRLVWYKIIGDDSWRHLEMTNASNRLYRGVCGELVCLGQRITRFYAEAGVTYYMRVYQLNSSIDTVNISMICAASASNDLCEDAQYMSCGDTINANFDYVSFCDEEKNCGHQGGAKKVWYKLIGNGEYIQLTISRPLLHHAQYFSMSVYEKECCNKKPLENLYGYEHDLYFYAKKDSSYLIEVAFDGYSINYPSNYELVVNCIPEEELDFNTCELAYPLLPDRVHDVTLSSGIPHFNENYPDNTEAVRWVTFLGTGGLDTIALDYGNSSRVTDFGIHCYLDLDQNCTLFNVKHSFKTIYNRHEPKVVFRIQTVKDLKYVVGIYANYEEDANTSVSIRFKPSQQSSLCNLVLPNVLELDYGYTKIVPLAISGAVEEFDVYVIDHNDRSSTQHFKRLRVGEHFNIMPLSSGTSVVEYSGDECYGHGLLNLKVNNVPAIEHPCSDTTVVVDGTCEEFIKRMDEELLDSTYQALIIESNAIIAPLAEVTYLAKEEVLLLPGFETESESDFTADIQDCELKANNQSRAIASRSIKPTVTAINWSIAPNPFAGQTIIEYQLPKQCELSIQLLNTQGQNLRTIVPKQTLAIGTYRQTLVERDLKSGLYYLLLKTSEGRHVKKVVVLK